MNTNVDPRRAAKANASKQDLRVWLAEMEAAGEVTHISGAEREREIGGIVDIYQRKIGNPAVLFDDIPGYPKGHRILANILTSIRRINMTMGNPADGSEIELVKHWRHYMKEAKTFPPVEVKTGALLGERQDRRRHRPVQDPGAELARARRRLLHRHRRHGGDEGPRHRLDQLRRLSRAGARQEARHRDVLQGQARRHDPEEVSRARPAVPGRGGVRHAPGAVHDRGPRNPARQERIRRGRRAAGRAGRSHHGAEDRPADPGARRDRVRGLHPSQRPHRRRPARRMDRLLRRRRQAGAGDPRRDHDVSRQPDPARRDPRHSARRRLVLSRLVPLRRGVEPARGRRRAGGAGACGRTRPAAAGSGSPSRSSRCTPAIPSRPG